jgi:hypothetical protein
MLKNLAGVDRRDVRTQSLAPFFLIVFGIASLP